MVTLLLILAIIAYATFKLFVLPYLKISRRGAYYGKSELYTIFFPLIGGFQKLQNFGIRGKETVHPLEYIGQILRENPRTKAVLSNLGTSLLWVLISAPAIKQLTLQESERFFKFLPIFNIDAISLSVLFTEGGKWRNQRKAMSPAFVFDELKDSEELIKRVVIESCTEYSGDSQDYKVLPITQLGMRISGELAVHYFFGQDFSKKRVNGHPIAVELGLYVDKLINYSHSSIYFHLKRLLFGSGAWNIQFLLTDYERGMLRDQEIFVGLARETVEKRLQELQGNAAAIRKNNFVDILIKQHLDSPNEVTVNEIVQQCMGMFIAAIDNTGVIMGMILYCLARYPAEGKLVREEVERVCGTRDITAALKHEDLSRLDYTLAFIKEVFRHYSSSTGIFIRCAQQDVQLEGLHIQKGDLVTVSWYGPFQNPEIYSEPQKFDPNRFFNQSLEAFAWTPFSAGAR